MFFCAHVFLFLLFNIASTGLLLKFSKMMSYSKNHFGVMVRRNIFLKLISYIKNNRYRVLILTLVYRKL